MIVTTMRQHTGQASRQDPGPGARQHDSARHLGRDIMAGLRNIVGGEIREYTKLMGEPREQALDRMRDEAKRLGANAIVGLRFTTSFLSAGAAELLAYGTAVTVEDE